MMINLPSLCLLQILFLFILTETFVIISREGMKGTPCILDDISPEECV